MDPDSHPDGALMNVVTGAIAPANVNIDVAVTVGKEQLETFESSWPEGFYSALKGQIVTFSCTRKTIKVGDIAVIDPEAIYARVIGLMVSQRELDLSDVFGCELAPYPPSMFHPDGSMRIATGKACLKKILAVETLPGYGGNPMSSWLMYLLFFGQLCGPQKKLSSLLSNRSRNGSQTTSTMPTFTWYWTGTMTTLLKAVQGQLGPTKRPLAEFTN
jgi:hypothetical protein